ncbi:MAG: hemerythrin domain-containing protein [Crocinitomicaceae bacterium]|nr:hemerythrin domain-containing protein [Crocinitomicaceae bacterium]
METKAITSFKKQLFEPYMASEKPVAPDFISTLVDSLQKSHELYLNKKLPEIQQSISHLSNKLDEKHHFFQFLATLFKRYEQSLLAHIAEEDEVIFPYVRYLLSCEGILDQAQATKILRGANSLQQYIATHSDTEEQLEVFLQMLEKAKKEIGNYYPFNVLLHQITWLKDDLNRHAFYEDEILVPIALRLENELINNWSGLIKN